MTAHDPALLEQIARIVSEKGAVPEGVDPFAFSVRILPLLGTLDGKLRDYRVYPILHLWAVRREMLDEKLRELLWAIAGEKQLFAGIGEEEADSIYLRAFSVLVLAPFVQAHREKAYLSREDLKRLLETVVRYLDAEEDLRGWVSPETMWAHATAHASDTFAQLAQCDEIGAEGLRAILECLGRNLVTDQTVWRHEEDSRAATAMIEALKRGLVPEDAVREWLSTLIPESRFEGEQPGTHYRFVNARNLLRCLIHQGEAEELPESVIALIREAHARLPER